MRFLLGCSRKTAIGGYQRERERERERENIL